MKILNCRICNSENLLTVINLGNQKITSIFKKYGEHNNINSYPINLCLCENCGLIQTEETTPPDDMYKTNNYGYLSSISNTMISHLKKYHDEILEKINLSNNDIVIDIGSNDGTFLQNFIKTEIDHLGFEPSRNVSDIAAKKGINSIPYFFSSKNIYKAENFIGKTDVIFGANVVCHIPDLVDFIKTCDILLNNNGKIIFEEPYLGAMYDKVSYDQIYDEHIFIFSISSIKNIFNLFDFELIDFPFQVVE
jgi:methylation protein EvaC